MATIFIDNKPYEVQQGQNLLQACLSLGFDIPYFCWHPVLHSVGACRQCAVKMFRDENDARGRIVMSCMTAVADGVRISIDDADARKFRTGIIEWLMLNHPHDCPVCDEGGECHLQDMTVMNGHTYRRTRFLKRTHRNQRLGPFINHEMNRCIQCYRCVRFYKDYAGGRDFGAFAAHHHVYFGRHAEGTLESEFSGNLVEICPTGVFTDKTFKRHYTRKWDLQTAPSVCIHCSVGCNTFAGERYGTLRRIMNRYNGEVNGYFLCDRGRFGYEFVNSGRRIGRPAMRSNGNTGREAIAREDAIAVLAGILSKSRGVIGIGSPRASLEANFALRTLVGPENFFAGVSEKMRALSARILSILMKGPARAPSLSEIARADAVFLIGEDVSNTAPMVALALRQSVRVKPIEISRQLHIPDWDDRAVRQTIEDRRGPLFIASTCATRLDVIATKTLRAAPADLARLADAVAGRLSARCPEVTGLSREMEALSQEIAGELGRANRPLIFSGAGASSKDIVGAAANAAWALCERGKAAGLYYAMPECNSMGLALMGGRSITDAVSAVRDGVAQTVIVLENDLFRYLDFAAAVDLCKAKHVVAMDYMENGTTARASIVLPAAPFAETDGTIVSSEGRAQRFYRVFPALGEVQESWRWLRDIMAAAGLADGRRWDDFDQVVSAMTEELPVFLPAREIGPPIGFRIAGMKVPRQSHRASGRTAMLAHEMLHEPKPPDDDASPLSFTMEGYQGYPPSSVICRYWEPGWNSVQSLKKFQAEVGGPLRGGDPGRRLIEPAEEKNWAYFAEVPGEFEIRRDRWFAVPLYHIFGSEELSAASGAAELAPAPYVALNSEDAREIGFADGRVVRVLADSRAWVLPLKYMASIPRGLAGLPAGLPGAPVLDLPAWIGIAPSEEELPG